jgi:hypothetical protein
MQIFHWIIRTCCAISALVCLMALVLFIRSFGISDSVRLTEPASPGTAYHLMAMAWQGSLCIDVAHVHGPGMERAELRGFRFESVPNGSPVLTGLDSQLNLVGTQWHFGFALQKYYVLKKQIPIMTIYFVAVPLWFIAILAAILPTAWYVVHRRAKRRVMLNCCQKCGYDLRATPHGVPNAALWLTLIT